VKKDGTREAFDRRKILKGLERACEKRPVSTDTLENIVSEIEREIYNKFDREVTTNFIGALVMQKLKIIDAVAYVRFASVYREFKDISEFIDELKPLMTNVPKKKKDGSSDSRSVSLQH
jgi:transcriptional repressor NrdR